MHGGCHQARAAARARPADGSHPPHPPHPTPHPTPKTRHAVSRCLGRSTPSGVFRPPSDGDARLVAHAGAAGLRPARRPLAAGAACRRYSAPMAGYVLNPQRLLPASHATLHRVSNCAHVLPTHMGGAGHRKPPAPSRRRAGGCSPAPPLGVVGAVGTGKGRHRPGVAVGGPERMCRAEGGAHSRSPRPAMGWGHEV